MKKIIPLFLVMVFLVGCSLTNSPKKSVEELFKKYQNLDEEVISDLEFTAEESSITNSSQKEDYIKAMKMQYSDLKYEILSEETDGDESVVTVKISVYDFYKAQKEADNYLLAHEEDFLDQNDVYDSVKFMSYKIKKMLDSSDRVEYTIRVDLKKKDNDWVVETIDKNTLKKIHGTYNYENN